MGEPFYIRPSTVQSFMLCPARAGLRGDSDYNYLPNEPLLFGSVTHWIIEQMQAGKVPKIDEVLGELDTIYAKDTPEWLVYAPLSRVTNRKQRLAIVGEALDAAESWVTDVEPKLPPDPLVEQTLAMTIGTYKDREIILRGTPDSVWLDEGLVADWKTAGKAWDAKKIEGQLQRIFYPMLAAHHHDVEIKRFDYWVFDRANAQWDQHKAIAPSKSEKDAASAFAWSTAATLIDGTHGYAPAGQAFHQTRGWHCSPKYCDAWAICVGKHLIRDGKASLPAITIKERWSE